jgi:hypothetical protein
LPSPFTDEEKVMATVIKYIQRKVERAFSFVAYVLMARSYGESRAAVLAWLAELMGWTRSWDPLAETRLS